MVSRHPSRAQITDAGLARRLGQKVHLHPRGKGNVIGKLVFYPDRFAVDSGEKLYNLRKKDTITWRTGLGRRRSVLGVFFTTYEYAGRGSGAA